MYSESDIEDAVAAGALSPEGAAALRRHVAAARAAPAVDEEHFRLLSGFNDIFVSVALVLLLVAVGWIGGSLYAPLGGVGVAAASWALAEFFTRRRRMALPSILLLLAFVGGIAGSVAAGAAAIDPSPTPQEFALWAAGVALAGVAAAWLHWRRFMVPITVAAGAVALAAGIGSLILAGFEEPGRFAPG